MKTPENLSKETVDEACVTSHHLKWSPFSPNEVGSILEQIRKGRGRKGRVGRNDFLYINDVVNYINVRKTTFFADDSNILFLKIGEATSQINKTNTLLLDWFVEKTNHKSR